MFPNKIYSHSTKTQWINVIYPVNTAIHVFPKGFPVTMKAKQIWTQTGKPRCQMQDNHNITLKYKSLYIVLHNIHRTTRYNKYKAVMVTYSYHDNGRPQELVRWFAVVAEITNLAATTQITAYFKSYWNGNLI